MNGRQLPERDYTGLKCVTRDLVKSAGDVNRAATITRVAASLLSRYGAPQDSAFMPIDVVADIECELGEPIITRYLADLLGYALVRKDEVPADATIVEEMAEAGKGMGEAGETFFSAMVDGQIDVLDAIKIQNTTTEVIRELEEVKATAKRIIDRKVVVPLTKKSA